MMTFPESAPAAWPVFLRSYSRRTAAGTRESFADVVDRNLAGLAELGKFTPEQIALCRKHQESLTSLPSGRWLWVGGTPWINEPRNYAGAFNCFSLLIDSAHAMALMMDLAMMGSGTGAVLEHANVSLLPPIANRLIVRVSQPIGNCKPDERSEETECLRLRSGLVALKVGDSRKGWVDSFQRLVELAMDPLLTADGELEVLVDLGSVRPPGERLKGFGGVANPAELVNLYGRMAKVINGATGRKLTPLEVCLLIDEGARTVVAGNIRRSAGMRQFSDTDILASSAKDNLWRQDDDGSWRIDPDRDALRMANHTRVFHSKPTRRDVVDSVRRQHQSGEGAIQYAPEAIVRGNVDLLCTESLRKRFLRLYTRADVDAARQLLSLLLKTDGEIASEEAELDHRMQRYGLNPCAEVVGHNFACNLAEVHLNQIDHKDSATIKEAFQAAALSVCALLRRNFTEPRLKLSRDLDPIVGVSFTGLFDHFALKFGPAWLHWWAKGRPFGKEAMQFRRREAHALRTWRKIVQAEVKAYCEKHDLRTPNRCTVVQPAGTKSLLTGASPGWHPPKAPRFIRRVTFGKGDPIALACIDYGYTVVPSQSDKDENGRLLDDPFDPRCTEWLVEMPVEVPWANLSGAEHIDPSKFSALAQFDFYMQVQRHWTTHTTSATIEFTESEIEPLAHAIHASIDTDQGYISAALLARSDCHAAFPRMPYETIDKATYGQLHAAVLERRGDTDFMEALARHDQASASVEPQGPAGCDSEACLLPLASPQDK